MNLPPTSFLNYTTPAFIPNTGAQCSTPPLSTLSGYIAQGNYSTSKFVSSLNGIPNSAFLALINGQVQMSSINVLSTSAVRLSAVGSNYLVNSPSTILTGTNVNYFYLTLPFTTASVNTQLQLEFINLTGSPSTCVSTLQLYNNSVVVPLSQNIPKRNFLL